jgi:DNA helicase-2/ATP-dependent DNA helicase PcrA
VLLPRTLTASQVVALAASAESFAADLARPMPRRPSSAARRGTAFHAWVEHRFESRPLFDPDDLPGAGDDDIPFDDDELSALREAFAATPYGDRRPYAIEAPFELNVGGRLIRGRIDAVYETEQGFDVVDYKTGLRPRDMAAAAWQLAVYRLAWAGLAGVPVDTVNAAFLYVRTGDLVRPELLDAEGLERLLTGQPADTDALDAHHAVEGAVPIEPDPFDPDPLDPDPLGAVPAEQVVAAVAAVVAPAIAGDATTSARVGAVAASTGKQAKPVDEDQLALDW